MSSQILGFNLPLSKKEGKKKGPSLTMVEHPKFMSKGTKPITFICKLKYHPSKYEK